MRNALELEGNLIVTTDNSGGIGEKSADVVAVPDHLTAFYAARVALLEQWAANAHPIAVLIHNFSGHKSWDKYVQGVQNLFQEAGLESPTISGSTETNMNLVQSAIAVTIIGKRQEQLNYEEIEWFTYGVPLVGEEVIVRSEEVASLQKIHQALTEGIVQRIWPIGSAGIREEIQKMTGQEERHIETTLDLEKSAGPSTVVLLAIPFEKREVAQQFFGKTIAPILF